MEKIFDVAIIGAGPAGSTLAYRLAQEKLKIILVDKEKFPREKVCAGGLTAKVFKFLPFNINSVIEKEIFQLCLIYKLKKQFTISCHKPLIYTTKRVNFDYFLVKMAKNAGVKFLPSNEVKIISPNDNFYDLQTKTTLIKSKIIVGADGAESFVAKFINFKPDYVDLGLQFNIPAKLFKKRELKGKIVLSWDNIISGYSWVFPQKNSFVVGVGGPAKLGKKLNDYLSKWSDWLISGERKPKLTGHTLVHRLRKIPIVKDNIILIGEAAGLNEPLSGEGIFYALKSAEIASRHIKDFFLGNKNAFKNYEKEINKEILPELKAADFFRKISSLVLPLAFRKIKTSGYYRNLLCRLIRGEKTFLEIKNQLKPLKLIRKIYGTKKEISRFAKSPRYT